MLAAVLDTHAAHWYIMGDARLSKQRCQNQAKHLDDNLVISPPQGLTLHFFAFTSQLSFFVLVCVQVHHARPSALFQHILGGSKAWSA
jgi:hypothetical protein